MRLPVPGPRDVLTALERGAGAVEQLLAAIPRLTALIADAERLVGQVSHMVDRMQPALTRLQPTLDRLAETTHPHEVDALVSLIDLLPNLAHKLEADVVPVLESLSTVAPDLHDLLDVSRELNTMLADLPLLGRLRQRVDDQQLTEGYG